MRVGRSWYGRPCLLKGAAVMCTNESYSGTALRGQADLLPEEALHQLRLGIAETHLDRCQRKKRFA